MDALYQSSKAEDTAASLQFAGGGDYSRAPGGDLLQAAGAQIWEIVPYAPDWQAGMIRCNDLQVDL